MRRPIGDWHVAAMQLWYTPGREGPEPANAGFDRAMTLLRRAAATWPKEVHLVDVSGFSEFERWQVYVQYARRCGGWGYALADVFGSRTRAGSYAGLSVPLLGVLFHEGDTPCAAPHRDLRPPAMRSILDVLRLLGPLEQLRLFGELA